MVPQGTTRLAFFSTEDSTMFPEHKQFLDQLRESGVCNMFESPQLLMRQFGLSRQQAMQVFKEWTKGFEG